MNKKSAEEKLKNLRNYANINNIPILRQRTGELLAETIRTEKPERILEIGTAVGYSGILMLSANEESESELVTIEKDEESAITAIKNFEEVGIKDRVKVIIGDAIDILPEISGQFDFIFLDGPKGQYIKYLPYLLKLLKTGGILFSDNVLYRGMVNGKTPIKKNKRTLVRNLKIFLDELDSNTNLENTTLDIEDGISVCRKLREEE